MKISHKRILVQLAFFTLFNAAFLGMPLLPLLLPVLECFSMSNKTVLCNFGVFQRNLSFTWRLSPVVPLASIAMFLIVGGIVGRAMCGWACPLGFFQDLWAHVPRFFKKRQKELSQRLHILLTSVKYMVLFGTIAIVMSVGAAYIVNWLLGRRYMFSLGVCGQAPYCLICPVPMLFSIIPSLLSTLFTGAPLPSLPLTFYVGFAAFMTLLVASLVVKRFWCRYICPLGALMSLFNRFSILRIKKKQGECTTFCRGHQKDCDGTCPMRIEVSHGEELSLSPECILCYNCAETCSNKAIKYKVG